MENDTSSQDARQQVGQQLSFALYATHSRIVRLHRPFLEPLGLTYPQFLVMMCLYESMPRTVGDIGSALGMDTGTLTPLLKRLVSVGLVTRERDTQDERRVLIGLTPAAKTIREAVLGIPAKIETACRLSNEDLANLRDTLNGLAHLPPSKRDEDKD